MHHRPLASTHCAYPWKDGQAELTTLPVEYAIRLAHISIHVTESPIAWTQINSLSHRFRDTCTIHYAVKSKPPYRSFKRKSLQFRCQINLPCRNLRKPVKISENRWRRQTTHDRRTLDCNGRLITSETKLTVDNFKDRVTPRRLVAHLMRCRSSL